MSKVALRLLMALTIYNIFVIINLVANKNLMEEKYE